VDCINHQSQTLLILTIPQARLEIGQYVRACVNIALLRRNYCPTALGFHASHRSHTVWHGMAHTVAMWYLIKTITGCNRTDLHSLKKNVVTGISRHVYGLLQIEKIGVAVQREVNRGLGIAESLTSIQHFLLTAVLSAIRRGQRTQAWKNPEHHAWK
jgi:hypothetical protein